MAAKVAVHALMGLCMVIWGVAYSPIAWALRDLTPLELATIRHVIAGGAFAALILASPSLRRLPERADVPRFAAVGFFMVVVYHLALYTGQEEIPPGTAALLVSSVPAMTAALSFLVLRERMPPAKLAGLALAFAGVAVVATLGTPGREATLHIAGLSGIVLLAPLSTAIFTVIGKPIAGKYGGPYVAAWGTLVGMALLLPWSLPLSVGGFGHLTTLGWASVLYLGLVSTALAFAIYYWGLQRLTATETTIYILLMPVAAVLFAATVFGQPVTPYVALGGALVLSGIALTNLAGVRAARAASAEVGRA
ncbi:MAG: DMT family transporter [Halobacteriales archaeon]|nr:DMT family transporter [Halobacteriales archaeon]